MVNSPGYNAWPFFAAYFGFLLILTVIGLFVCAIPMAVLFHKAGVSWWKSFIPVYSTYCRLVITGLPGWLILLEFIPLANLGFMFINLYMRYRLARCFGKSMIFSVVSIPLDLFCTIIMAVDRRCVYEGVK